jgi:hypothetical protein
MATTGEYRDAGVCRVVNRDTVTADHHVLLVTPPGSLDELISKADFFSYLVSSTGARLEAAADGLRVSASAAGEGLAGGGPLPFRINIPGLPVGTVDDDDLLMFWDTFTGTLRQVEAGDLIGAATGATNLGLTVGASSLDITSSTGDDVTLPAATSTDAGLLLPAEKVAIGSMANAGAFSLLGNATSSPAAAQSLSKSSLPLAGVGAGSVVAGFSVTGELVTFTAANLGNLVSTPGATSIVVTNAVGTALTLEAATITQAGVLSAADKTALNDLVGNPTHLAATPSPTTVTVTNTTGNDAVLPAATTELAGVMTAADKVALAASASVTADLAVSFNSVQATVTNTKGTGFVLVAATDLAAGLMTAADKTALDTLVVTPLVTLAVTPAAAEVEIGSTGATPAILPAATTSDAGAMSAADKTALNGLLAAPLAVLAVTQDHVTELEIGTQGGTPVIVPEATTSFAGLLSAADKTLIASLSSSSTNLAVDDTVATQITISNTAGTDAVILAATATTPGIMTAADKALIDSLAANSTNLASVQSVANQVTITNTTGTDAVIVAATITNPGIMSATDKTRVDALWARPVDWSQTTAATTHTIVNPIGVDAVLPAATTTVAGLLTGADKTNLNALVTKNTTLAVVQASTTVLQVGSMGGVFINLPPATTGAAGVMTAEDKTKLDGLTPGSPVVLGATRTASAVTITDGGAPTPAVVPLADNSLAGLLPGLTSLGAATGPPATGTDLFLGYSAAGTLKAFKRDYEITNFGHGRTAADIGKPIVGLGSILNDALQQFPTGILKFISTSTLTFAAPGDVLDLPVSLLEFGNTYSLGTLGRYVFWDLSFNGGQYRPVKPTDSAAHLPDLLEILSVGSTTFKCRVRDFGPVPSSAPITPDQNFDFVDEGSVSGAKAIDLSVGVLNRRITLTGDATITFSAPPPKPGLIIWNIVNTGNFKINWPTAIIGGIKSVRTWQGNGARSVVLMFYDGPGYRVPHNRKVGTNALLPTSVISTTTHPGINWDVQEYDSVLFALAANMTINASSFVSTVASDFTCRILQDVTGGRTINWVGFIGEPPTIRSAANQITIVRVYFDGTSWHFLGTKKAQTLGQVTVSGNSDPNVSGLSSMVFSGVLKTMPGGVPGQRMVVYANGATTILHNTLQIVNTAGGNLSLPVGKLASYILIGSVWVQT